jgi:parvulin-like peptidyl-prolyl isomerase
MKTIMWVVAGSFFLGFIILSDGLNVGRGGGVTQSNAIGSVNGREIPPDAYREVRNQFIDSERIRNPRGELRSSDYERLEEAAWDYIVTQMLLEQEADRLGLVTLDEDVFNTMVRNPPAFVRQQFTDQDGQFDVEAYQRALSDPNTDWRPAEREVARQVRLQKLQMMVYASASVSEAQVREEYMRRELRSTARYVGQRWSEIDLGDYEPGAEELRQFYEEHSDVYSRGEHVILEALRIEKRASHEDQAELLQESEQMIAELRSGSVSSFASLAEIYSESPSASSGGELGWSARGSLPTEVADAAWGLEPGQRTAPVVSVRGVHIVQVDSLRLEADSSSSLFLREVFLALEPSRDTLDSLNQLAFDVAAEARDDFEAAAQRGGLGIETLAPLESSGFLPGFGFSVRMRKWAFGAQHGDVGGPFFGDDAYLVVRLAEHRAAAPRPFAEVEARVRAGLLEDRKKGACRDTIQAVVDAVRGGSSLADAARSQSLTVEEPEPFGYYDGVPGPGGDNEFTAAAYSLLPGQTSPVIETSTGAYVVELLERDAFDEVQYRAVRDTHYQSLLSRRATQIYEAWLQRLRKAADIVDKRSPA